MFRQKIYYVPGVFGHLTRTGLIMNYWNQILESKLFQGQKSPSFTKGTHSLPDRDNFLIIPKLLTVVSSYCHSLLISARPEHQPGGTVQTTLRIPYKHLYKGRNIHHEMHQDGRNVSCKFMLSPDGKKKIAKGKIEPRKEHA